MDEPFCFFLIGSRLCADQHRHVSIALFEEPAPVRLRRKETAQGRPLAIEVRAVDGSLLGHMPQSLARAVGDAMRPGELIEAEAQLSEGNQVNPSLPLQIVFSLDQAALESTPGAIAARELGAGNDAMAFASPLYATAAFSGADFQAVGASPPQELGARGAKQASGRGSSGSSKWSDKLEEMLFPGETLGRAAVYGCLVALLFWGLFAMGHKHLFGEWMFPSDPASSERASAWQPQPAEAAFFPSGELPNRPFSLPPVSAANARLTLKSATMGDPGAQFRLAMMLQTGNGAKIDVDQSQRWLTIAAQNGNAQAAYGMGVFALNAAPRPLSEVTGRKARAWFEQAARAGQADAQYALGLLDLTGVARAPSEASARRRFQVAAANGSPEAQRWLLDHPPRR